jgi:Tfp pilus assembly protein PilN
MALPQQVIDRLSREPPKTPGWSFGVLLFSGGVFAIALVVYLGLAFGYGPYLDSQLTQLNAKIDVLAKSISADDQAKLITFYSEIANVKNALANHVIFSRFLSWLERNTVANVYFSRMTFSSGNQINFMGVARTEAEINQQIAILEAAPELRSITLSTVSLSEATGLWQFNVTIVLDPQAILRRAPS